MTKYDTKLICNMIFHEKCILQKHKIAAENFRKVHPHEKHIISKFDIFTKMIFSKSSLQKSAFHKPASGWPQAGRTPAVRRPAPGRPPAVHRAGTGTAADWPGGHFPIVK